MLNYKIKSINKSFSKDKINENYDKSILSSESKPNNYELKLNNATKLISSHLCIMSGNNGAKPQITTVDFIEHYRNIYAAPQNFIKRRVDYSRMKVFDDKYRKESERLLSFKDFPKHLCHLTSSIAKSGFYYIGNSKDVDQVKCIFCQGILSTWKKADKPEKEHRKNFPTCPYLLNLNVGNEPLKEESKKRSNVDPELKDFNGDILHNVIGMPHESVNFLNDLNDDIDWRENTFQGLDNLKHLSMHGLFIEEEEIGIKFIKCYICYKKTEVLKNISKLSISNFHKSDCNFHIANSSVPLLKEIKTPLIDNNKKKEKYSCKVEYSITNDEIEARMDSRKANEIEKIVGNRTKVKSLISSKLKTCGKDYESIFELLHDLKNFEEYECPNDNINSLEFILQDHFCVVCLDKPIEVVFLPCGHLRSCRSCSDALTTCPICRKLIERRVRGVRFFGK